MNIIKAIFGLLGIIFGYAAAVMVLYFVIKTTVVQHKHRLKSPRKHTWKRRRQHYYYWLLKTRYIKLADFIKWVVYDILHGKDGLKLFGIWAFTGYYGEGKTMGCVQFAKGLQRKYPHRGIKIYSNINIKGQVKRLTSWEDIIDLPPNSIFIYDESQSDWSCNLGANAFPEDLLRRITQVRKKQFALFMTSPRYNRMNINIRESCNFVIECKNIMSLDRWFKYVFYRAEEYEQYAANPLGLIMHKYLTMDMVINNWDYKMYDTTEVVGSIKECKRIVTNSNNEIENLKKQMYRDKQATTAKLKVLEK